MPTTSYATAHQDGFVQACEELLDEFEDLPCDCDESRACPRHAVESKLREYTRLRPLARDPRCAAAPSVERQGGNRLFVYRAKVKTCGPCADLLAREGVAWYKPGEVARLVEDVEAAVDAAMEHVATDPDEPAPWGDELDHLLGFLKEGEETPC